jgi:hypothetical protein
MMGRIIKMIGKTIKIIKIIMTEEWRKKMIINSPEI